jgi:hypothetical protein
LVTPCYATKIINGNVYMKNKFLLGSLILLGIVACRDDFIAPVDPPIIYRVEVYPEELRIERDQEYLFTVRVYMDNNEIYYPLGITWESTNTSVATITNQGVLTTHSIGNTFVRARFEEATSQPVFVSVTREEVASVDMSFNQPNGGLFVGSSVLATLVARSSNGKVINSLPPIWSSSNPIVAHVLPNGLITAHSEGTADITATVDGASTTRRITTRLIPVDKVFLSTPTPPFYVGREVFVPRTLVSIMGDTLTLAQRNLTWTSSDTGVAIITSTGISYGVAPGEVQFSLTVENREGSYAVGVLDALVTRVPINKIEFTTSRNSMIAGQQAVISVRARDEQGRILSVPELDGRRFNWQLVDVAGSPLSFTPSIVQQNASRQFTAVSVGVVDIVVTIDGEIVTRRIEVFDALEIK